MLPTLSEKLVYLLNTEKLTEQLKSKYVNMLKLLSNRKQVYCETGLSFIYTWWYPFRNRGADFTLIGC